MVKKQRTSRDGTKPPTPSQPTTSRSCRAAQADRAAQELEWWHSQPWPHWLRCVPPPGYALPLQSHRTIEDAAP